MRDDVAVLRIGEVARRTGVAVSTLRAWERRYELLDPTRTEGGHRLYSEQDVARVRRMQQLTDQGWSAAAAAREVGRSGAGQPAGTAPPGAGPPAEELVARLKSAMDRFDAAEADTVLDDALARLELGTVLDQVVVPALRWVGEGWDTDPRIIAREHLATNALRPRLLRLLRTSVGAGGRTCVAAAPEHEEHDLGLLSAAAVLADAGWRVHFLGARTPTRPLERAVQELRAEAVLVAALAPAPAREFLDSAPALGDATVLLGGAGFAAVGSGNLPHAAIHDGDFRDLPAMLESALAR